MEQFEFKIRASQASKIISGNIGLTEIQIKRLDELQERFNGIGKPLTENLNKERLDLHKKHTNRELPDGLKTYCQQWLKEFLYKRRPNIKSKYLTKGNICEEDGFTLMALQLNLGMVYKNEKFFENDYACGTPDLIVNDTVYDNKCSWSLDTFPMYDKEPNNDYWWQLQTYMFLTGCRKSVLAYTLIDAPLELIEQAVKWIDNQDEIYKTITNMVYTKNHFDAMVERFCPLSELDFFIEIPEEKRIKTFEIAFDESAIEKLKGRVLESRIYLNKLIS